MRCALAAARGKRNVAWPAQAPCPAFLRPPAITPAGVVYPTRWLTLREARTTTRTTCVCALTCSTTSRAAASTIRSPLASEYLSKCRLPCTPMPAYAATTASTVRWASTPHGAATANYTIPRACRALPPTTLSPPSCSSCRTTSPLPSAKRGRGANSGTATMPRRACHQYPRPSWKCSRTSISPT